MLDRSAFDPPPALSEYWSGVITFLIMGGVMGGFLGAISLIGHLLTGRLNLAALASIGVTYVGGGLLGGLLLGIGHRLIRGYASAALFGAIALLPTTAAVGIRMYGPVKEWPSANFVDAVLTAIVLGGGVGAVLYRDHKTESKAAARAETSGEDED